MNVSQNGSQTDLCCVCVAGTVSALLAVLRAPGVRAAVTEAAVHSIPVKHEHSCRCHRNVLLA